MDSPLTSSGNNRLVLFAALVWLVAAGLLVRVWGLWNYWLSPDEVLILQISGAPSLAAVWKGLSSQAHPPLHFFLLHYLLMLSRNVLFLKASSLLPGLALIPLCFFLGRKISGNVSGLAMAFMAAFGYGPMLMSEIIRPYALLALLLCVALWFYLSYARGGRRIHAYGYALFMFLALCIHYSAVIAIAGISGVWLAKTALRRRPFAGLVFWFYLHLPLLVISVVFYVFHLSRITASRKAWMETYLRLGFAASPAAFAHHLYTVLFFLFYRPLAPLFAALALLGFYALWKSSREALAVIAAVFTCGLALSLLHVYPLYGSRHCIYLFPFAAVLAGAAAQYLFETVKLLPGHFPAWQKCGSTRLGPGVFSFAALGLTLGSTLVIIGQYSKDDFFRGYDQAVRTEFTLTRAAYDKTFEYLDQNVRPGDLIFSPRQAGDYAAFAAGAASVQELSRRLARVRCRGQTFYFDRELWMFSRPGQLRARLRELASLEPIKSGKSLWIINIGYGNGMLKYAVNGLFSPYLPRAEMVERESVIIYKIPAAALLEALKNTQANARGH